ncbi:adenylosuccinate lyase [Pseudochryseolinea flava]|uniref:Adenylosuccinate lyase n=1 Tax=Pseudochryseolinea flava TaxID=2059302 RepID=A0A364XX85_9BACT|nr:adenylosuccinate lyase [Pseudochryseolinea flava]RAV98813.1 adenylosuccinate lyase [Pseudochryseolinea flava]
MQLNPLTAISPVDGRYFETVKPLAPYFSEAGLIKYRIQVEIEYLINMSATVQELEDFPIHQLVEIRKIYKNFTEFHAQEVKDIEKTTNHDVKAVEYYIKREFDRLKLDQFKEFVHFGLTSQDINNTAIPLLLKEFMEKEYYNIIDSLLTKLNLLGRDWKDIPMLAFTHGQPASPTRLGKEIMVFAKRLEKQLQQLKTVPHAAKFGGATGNFNAHHVAYPDIDWNKFGDEFCTHLGLSRSYPTTQIEHYDNLAALFDNIKRINTILIDFSRDMWQYISMEYFKQKIKEGEVGSSAMPHKVNPIDFENAEGNLGFANGIFEYLSGKLPISRLQRDLTDSTVLRNIGVPMAHTYVAIHSLLKGINKLELNRAAIERDLNENWAVVAEAIQTILRKEGYPNPYEALKALTRKNEKVTQESLATFIDELKISDTLKTRLKAITPFTYTGI